MSDNQIRLYKSLLNPDSISSAITNKIHGIIIDGIFNFVTGTTLSTAITQNKIEELHRKIDAMNNAKFFNGMNFLEFAYYERSKNNKKDYIFNLQEAKKNFVSAKNIFKPIYPYRSAVSEYMLGIIFDLEKKHDLALKSYENSYLIANPDRKLQAERTIGGTHSKEWGKRLLRTATKLTGIGLIPALIWQGIAESKAIDRFSELDALCEDLEPILKARKSKIKTEKVSLPEDPYVGGDNSFRLPPH